MYWMYYKSMFYQRWTLICQSGNKTSCFSHLIRFRNTTQMWQSCTFRQWIRWWLI
uniref:Uncharacterized protein n=1 Tax=uncultured marine virus TaxID=186617 RepID=A0A0F7L333_9VIRU|nr:hypothetical protein [uncultured marine virus]